jgi:hypothetical protein
MNAQRLLSECTATTGSFEEDDCIGYIEGVQDMLTYLQGRHIDGIQLPCLPPKMTTGQIEAVVAVFVRRNPQFYNADAAPVTYAALLDAFPCR